MYISFAQALVLHRIVTNSTPTLVSVIYCNGFLIPHLVVISILRFKKEHFRYVERFIHICGKLYIKRVTITQIL